MKSKEERDVLKQDVETARMLHELTDEDLAQVSGGQGTGSLGDITQYDIETIDILKGASSAAIYGSGGAKGVILVK